MKRQQIKRAEPSIFILASVVHAHYWFVKDFPHTNESCEAQQYCSEIGGKGLNVSIATHRQGLHTIPIFGCGIDQTSQHVIALLEQEGIHQARVIQFTDFASGQGAGFINQDGHNMIAIALGANLALTADDIVRHQRSIDESHFIYAQFETAIGAIGYSFEYAHSLGKTTFLNPSPYQEPPQQVKDHTDWLIVNEIEVLSLLKIESLGLQENFKPTHTALTLRSALKKSLQYWPNLKILLVTLGEVGAFMLQIEDIITVTYVSGIQVERVDPTGCGDTFAASFCYAVANNFTLINALEYANCAGAIMAQAQGVLAHLPYTSQIQQLYHSSIKQTAQVLTERR